ncbi:MAG TPA: gluconate 2-dehydrogenase subunit 3 family protein [Casimicrobiaceae bacterium]|nr:gluconate 2-dehydrogenase subunit 3 family protein [Casimicrobiaceae bacterium]
MSKVTRRDILRTAAAAGSAAVVSWFAPSEALGRRGSLLPPPIKPDRFSYLTQAEIAFVDAAVGRLIPADELGPGAREAGVTFFIDQQLAGPFGRGESWYMQGPWKKGTEQQGYQLRLSPAQLYRAGIGDADRYCLRTFKKSFAELAAADQDKVLHGLEKGEIDLPEAPAKLFFDMLLQNTNEGFFADPVYGGNRGFIGWKLVGFPGPRYNYVNEIEQYGKPYALPTVGLAGRQGLPPMEKD